MPFTPAHAAAIVPLRSRFTVTSALVIGSMAPDYEYFVRARLLSTLSHTFLGVFAFCLPAGIAVFLIARRLRPGFILLMPRVIRERLPHGSWNHAWPAIAMSVTAGAFTHVILDSFTHRSGWSAQQLGFDRTVIAGVPVYSALQHLSTLVGLTVITALVARFLARQPPVAQELDQLRPVRITFWICAVAVPPAVFAACILSGVAIGTAVVRAIDALILVTALFSFIGLRPHSVGPAV